ncbi:uncharacterized protein BJ171DRAFT_136962 [Polychytrium aggregatum]|uniref:uncharacterized protein n=1 Tax=Polychytrium aggregatum TaxID=110093 RepID=UPI0022FE618B|nr:uncharacterized protein BJ171DRAFT_136962 [Polychytrium aggregatum]KAI9203582.1 hypothetical protein BJ171DRAFT_136962 [Polychytrium aggregatum]
MRMTSFLMALVSWQLWIERKWYLSFVVQRVLSQSPGCTVVDWFHPRMVLPHTPACPGVPGSDRGWTRKLQCGHFLSFGGCRGEPMPDWIQAIRRLCHPFVGPSMLIRARCLVSDRGRMVLVPGKAGGLLSAFFGTMWRGMVWIVLASYSCRTSIDCSGRVFVVE